MPRNLTDDQCEEIWADRQYERDQQDAVKWDAGVTPDDRAQQAADRQYAGIRRARGC